MMWQAIELQCFIFGIFDCLFTFEINLFSGISVGVSVHFGFEKVGELSCFYSYSFV